MDDIALSFRSIQILRCGGWTFTIYRFQKEMSIHYKHPDVDNLLTKFMARKGMSVHDFIHQISELEGIDQIEVRDFHGNGFLAVVHNKGAKV